VEGLILKPVALRRRWSHDRFLQEGGDGGCGHPHPSFGFFPGILGSAQDPGGPQQRAAPGSGEPTGVEVIGSASSADQKLYGGVHLRGPPS
jgi:hypothetical protein